MSRLSIVALSLAFLVLAVAAHAKEKLGPSFEKGSLIDKRNNTKYETVKIGSQVWMSENLDLAYGNSWCYENKPENCQKYGRLYDWASARKVCPDGWTLPADEDWSKLGAATGEDFAGMNLKSSTGWNGIDANGFNAEPGGFRDGEGNFFSMGSYTAFWSSTENGTDNAWSRSMNSGDDALNRHTSKKNAGRSVRCLKTKP